MFPVFKISFLSQPFKPNLTTLVYPSCMDGLYILNMKVHFDYMQEEKLLEMSMTKEKEKPEYKVQGMPGRN